MGRMGKMTRVENRGETTRGERTIGGNILGRNVLLPFWAGPPITKLFLGPSLLLAKNVSVGLKIEAKRLEEKGLGGGNILLPFWAGPPITKLFLGPSLLLAKNVSVSLISKHTFT